MFKSPRRTFFILLTVVLVALFLGLFLRGMIIQDFRRLLEDERLDLVRLVSSDIEGSYAKYKQWNGEDAADAAVRALLLGIQLKVVDANNDVVMDTEKALALLPLGRKASIVDAAGFSSDDKSADYHSYPLFLGGERIGSLEVKFLRTGKEDLFIRRSGIFVLVWSFLLAGPVLVLGILLSRKPAGLIGTPVRAAADSTEVLNAGMPVSEKAETAPSPETPDQEPEKEIPFQGGPELSIPADEEEREAMPDDDLDAGDEDMQPIPGDADRITTIVKGLDELAKAQALRSSMRKQPIELAEYLHDIVEKARGSVQGKDVTFNLECESNLSLSADPVCLTGIMANLLDNAAKAVKKEGTVTVSAAAEGEHVIFAVRDTGTGIRRKDLPHIFEQYYRASGGGIGLGLTIVKELVDACGGKIEVQTERGKGSIFTVRIPLS